MTSKDKLNTFTKLFSVIVLFSAVVIVWPNIDVDVECGRFINAPDLLELISRNILKISSYQA